MGSPRSRAEALRNTARVALLLAVAAFGALLVRNITDVLRGIAGELQLAAVQAPAPEPSR